MSTKLVLVHKTVNGIHLLNKQVSSCLLWQDYFDLTIDQLNKQVSLSKIISILNRSVAYIMMKN